MAPTPPGTPAARSASPRMRNLSCAVKVRRRGRPKSSGDAAAGAETIFGLRPSSLSAPAAAGVLLSLIRGITTGCLSYALKGKLPAGLCLIIIGTEGRLRTHLSQPEDDVGGDADGREEGVGATIVTGSDAAPVLKLGEHVLDLVALPVENFIVSD